MVNKETCRAKDPSTCRYHGVKIQVSPGISQRTKNSKDAPNTGDRLWILTEENPKWENFLALAESFCNARNIPFKTVGTPSVATAGKVGWFKLVGVRANHQDVHILMAKGSSSFMDIMFYYQPQAPTPENKPEALVELTKTTSSESRNTALAQRATKFIY